MCRFCAIAHGCFLCGCILRTHLSLSLRKSFFEAKASHEITFIESATDSSTTTKRPKAKLLTVKGCGTHSGANTLRIQSVRFMTHQSVLLMNFSSVDSKSRQSCLSTMLPLQRTSLLHVCPHQESLPLLYCLFLCAAWLVVGRDFYCLSSPQNGELALECFQKMLVT